MPGSSPHPRYVASLLALNCFVWSLSQTLHIGIDGVLRRVALAVCSRRQGALAAKVRLSCSLGVPPFSQLSHRRRQRTRARIQCRRCVNYLHQILTQTKSLDVVHRPKRLVLKVRTRTRPAYARVWPMLINGGAIKQRIEMMPVPDVDMIKGGFWPVVELVDMHRFHSPFFLKKAHRYNTFFFIV